MTSEHLLHAIGMLDDELVAEAAATVRRRIPPRAYAGLAAALVLCVGLLTTPALFADMAKSGMSATPEAADGAAEDMYQYVADQEMQLAPDSTNRSEEPKYKETLPNVSVTAGSGVGAVSDAFKPLFITPRGIYRITVLPTDASPTLPADAVSLGSLQQHPCDDATLPATNDKTLVGSPVWESADGLYLYIQHNTGWFIAKLLS